MGLTSSPFLVGPRPVPRSFPQSHQKSPRERQEMQGAAEMKTVRGSELVAMTIA